MQYINSNQYFGDTDFPFHIFPHTISSGRVVAPHSHEFIELVYVLKGTGFHEYRGDWSTINEGDIFIIEPELQHSFRVEADQPPVEVYNILFHQTLLTKELRSMIKHTPFVNFFFIEPFLRQNTGSEYTLSIPSYERSEVEMLIKSTLREYKLKEMGYRIRIKAKLIDLLILLSRCYDQKKGDLSGNVTVNDEQTIQNICGFIEAHYAHDFSLQYISKFCGMSQSAFVSKFKQYTQKTFVEFRNEVRIREAQKLLLRSTMSISDIAFEVGYNNFSHFNKLFKRISGSTPKYYRNHHSG